MALITAKILQRFSRVFIAMGALCFLTNAAFACASNEIDVLGDGTQCETTKFSVTTTSDTELLKFSFTLKGTVYVDCGDGGTLGGDSVSGKTITRTNEALKSSNNCAWNTLGTHTIRFGSSNMTKYPTGNAPISFYSSSDGTQDKIASVSGSLGDLFPALGANSNQVPRFNQTFRGATNLTTIPAGLFSGVNTSSATSTSSMFQQTFYGCTSLTSIPDGLFSGVNTSSATDTSGMFSSTFNGCTGITSIPTGLFSSVDTSSSTNTSSMFKGTFKNTAITGIPAGLFSDIDISSVTNTNNMFDQTFMDCAALESIPSGLFSNITMGGNYMFSSTFENCTALKSIPSDLFTNITTPAQYLFNKTFSNCTGLGGESGLDGYIPATIFAGILNGDIDNYDDGFWRGVFRNTFTNTGPADRQYNFSKGCPVSDTSIAAFETPYDKYFGERVMCACTNGYYGGDAASCQPCSGSKPSNSSFQPSINAACPWACNDEYVQNGNTCTYVTCTGTKYYDSVTGQCAECPDGYTYNTKNKREISQCQKRCDGGYWIEPEYIQLEYIESTGSQYIDTGVAPKDIAIMEIDMQFNDTGISQQSGIHSNGRIFKIGIALAGNFLFQSAGDDGETNFGYADTNRHLFGLNRQTGKGYIDDDVRSVNVANVSQYTESIHIGNTNGIARPSRAKYYKFTLYDSNGKVVADYRPAKEVQTGKIGFYDDKSKQFLSSATSTEFIAGPIEHDDGGNEITFGGGGDCVPVGAGYYKTSAQVVGYGNPGVRLACIKGTYSDIDNATTCTKCPLGTYNDKVGQTSCTWCPDGWRDRTIDGRTAIVACYKHCDAGTHVAVKPVVYKQLNYIETGIDESGNPLSYIDTGIKHQSSNVSGEITFGTPLDFGTSGKFSILGTADYTVGWEGGKFNISVGGNKLSATTNRPIKSAENGTIKEYTVNYSFNGNNRTIDGKTGTYDNVNNDITANTLYLFRNPDNSNSTRLRIYEFKLYENGDLAHDFIPVIATTYSLVDGVYVASEEIGMYDTVSEEFFGYSGEKGFIPGQVLENVDQFVSSNARECTDVDVGRWIPEKTVTLYGAVQNGGNCNNRISHSIYTGHGTAKDANNKTNCPWACDGKYYLDNDACVLVGNGYYSPAGDNESYECTNKVENSIYTGSGTDNDCPWGCDAQYCLNNDACVAAESGYYSAAGTNECTACTNTKPANSEYTGSAASNNCPWGCVDSYTEYNGLCHAACPVNNLRVFHAGNVTYPLFADRESIAAPVLHVRDTASGQMCYAYFEQDAPGDSNKSGFHVRWKDNKTYHAVDPR